MEVSLLLVLQIGLLPFVTAAAPMTATGESTNLQTFQVQGTVQRVEADGSRLLIAHEAIPGYMPAMTMPFRVLDTNESAGLRAGVRIRFELHVDADKSWIQRIARIGQTALPVGPMTEKTNEVAVPPPHHPLLEYPFTNELGQPVRLADFRGQALAITFFFTRCPIPDYCPRLSKNFQAASRKLETMTAGPTNWHFLSITFDPDYDTASVLKSYAASYHYDPAHWSFLTGPADKIHELAASCGVTFEADSGLFNHNFRTLIIDANGRLQMVFPISGDFSAAIVDEILKAAAPTNHPSSTASATTEHGAKQSAATR
jgi:protein SCO1/2